MTTLFLATTGGHLTQLNELSKRMPSNGAALWVTHENEQSTSLLADRDVQFVPYVGLRDVPNVLRCVPIAHRLMSNRKLTRAVSTGSGIALGFLPYLAAHGVECHYIESATRVLGPSLTGKTLQWVPGIRTYTQYPHWVDKRWQYAGSVFDGYQATAAPHELTDQVRVVVTVGTAAEFPFRRLFERLAPLLAPDGPLHRKTGLAPSVLWQTAGTPVEDLAIHPTPFLPAGALRAALAEADIVISHAGTGSALTALASGRFPLLITRDVRYGEIVDNHQRQLASELARRGLCRYREPESITVDDLVMTLSMTVRRVSNPRPLNFDQYRTVTAK
jgi:UDP-N-acetylglucosamine transferase subunit ALG13